MYQITKNGLKIALKLSGDDFTDGLNFFSDAKDFIQVGSWRYNRDKLLAAHNHNFFCRQVNRTQEVVFVIKGSLEAMVYDEDDTFLDTLKASTGEVLVFFGGGHGYRILEDDTIVVEIKNGPYPGSEKDRRRLPGN